MSEEELNPTDGLLEDNVGEPSEEALTEDTVGEAEPEVDSSAKRTEKKQKGQVNLDDMPEFRAWKRQADLREKALQDRLASLERQQWEALPEDERQQAEYQSNMRRLRDLEEQNAKLRILQKWSVKTGVPVDVLEEASDFEEAADIAFDYLRKEQADNEKQRRRSEKLENNRVVVGGGKPKAEQSRDEKAQAALAEGDAMSFYRILLGDES